MIIKAKRLQNVSEYYFSTKLREVAALKNQGKPIILNKKSDAGQAYKRIAGRLCGQEIDLADVENPKSGILHKFKGMFK